LPEDKICWFCGEVITDKDEILEHDSKDFAEIQYWHMECAKKKGMVKDTTEQSSDCQSKEKPNKHNDEIAEESTELPNSVNDNQSEKTSDSEEESNKVKNIFLILCALCVIIILAIYNNHNMTKEEPGTSDSSSAYSDSSSDYSSNDSSSIFGSSDSSGGFVSSDSDSSDSSSSDYSSGYNSDAYSGTSSLQVQEGWTWTIDGDYDYINGSVKNIGSKTISYFEVTVDFLDASGNVLDSDYTNSGQNLNAGNMKAFDLMHEHISGSEKARAYVNEVEFEY